MDSDFETQPNEFEVLGGLNTFPCGQVDVLSNLLTNDNFLEVTVQYKKCSIMKTNAVQKYCTIKTEC